MRSRSANVLASLPAGVAAHAGDPGHLTEVGWDPRQPGRDIGIAVTGSATDRW